MNPSIKSVFSISGILNKISKTLNIANQIIPIYQKAKPLLKNSQSILNSIKTISKKEVNSNIKVNKTQKTESISNNPVFFS